MKSFEAIVTVLDKASEPLRRADERAALLHKRLQSIGEASGLKGLVESGHRLEQSLGRAAGIAMKIAAPLLALGGAAGGFGLADIVEKAADLGDKLHNASLMTGLAVDKLAAYRYAARQAGVDTDLLSRGMVYLNRGMVDAARGKNLDVAQIFRAMGVAIRDGQGHVISGAKALHAIADETKYLEEHGRGNVAEAMLSKLFGERSGAELLPLFEKGGTYLDRMQKTARQHGLAPDAAEVGRLQKLHESLIGLRASVEGFGLAVADKLAPYLIPLMDRMSAWLDQIRSNGTLDRFVDKFVKAVEKVNWQAVWQGIGKVADSLQALLKLFGGNEGAFGGAINTAEIFAALWAGKWLFQFNRLAVTAAATALSVAKIGKNLFAASSWAEAAAAAKAAGTEIGTALGLGIVGGLGAAVVVGAKTGLDALAHSLGLPSDTEAANDYWARRNEDKTPSWLRWAEPKNWFGGGAIPGVPDIHAAEDRGTSSSSGGGWWDRMHRWFGNALSPGAYTIGSALQRAQERAESGGRQFDRWGHSLVSAAGAVGVMQLLPSTAAGVARALGETLDMRRLYNDAGYNRHLGEAYMRQLLGQFHGDVPEALAAYNWGPDNVARAVRRWGDGNFLAHTPLETRRYVAGILRDAFEMAPGGSAHIVIDHRHNDPAIRTTVTADRHLDLEYREHVGMAFG